MADTGYPTLTLDNSLKPSALVLPQTPTYQAYNPNLKMSDYVGQAHTLLQPQLDANIQDINLANKQTVQNANNDTLRRGLARGSYAGARVDTINANNDRVLQRERLNNDMQANSMATGMYDKAWDRGYTLNKDQNDYNWNNYNANVNSATTQYSNAYQGYRDSIGDQQWTYGQKSDQYEWTKTFDQNKLESDRNYSLALKNSNKSGGSGSSSEAYKGVDGEKIAQKYVDYMNIVTNALGTAKGNTVQANAILDQVKTALYGDTSAYANDIRNAMYEQRLIAGANSHH